MIGILLEDDFHCREVMIGFLQECGYTTVFCAANVDEASFYFSEYAQQIKIIVCGNMNSLGLDLPLSRLIIQNRSLDLVPLVMLTNEVFSSNDLNNQHRLSRLDAILQRPFGKRTFKKAICKAHERRALLRNHLIYFGDKLNTEISETVYAESEHFHWRKVSNASSIQELKDAVQQVGFQLGSICIDEDFINDELVTYLKKFKKEILGSVTSLCVFGQDPLKIRGLRSSGDVFYDTHHPLNEMLSLLSCRIQFQFEMKEDLHLIRHALKQKNIKKASELLSQSMQLDQMRWELLELSGMIEVEKKNFKQAEGIFMKALETQPCSAFSYLNLIAISQQSEAILKKAIQYCPLHPEILKLSEKLNAKQGNYAK